MFTGTNNVKPQSHTRTPSISYSCWLQSCKYTYSNNCRYKFSSSHSGRYGMWDVTPYTMVKNITLFIGTCCLHLQVYAQRGKRANNKRKEREIFSTHDLHIYLEDGNSGLI